MKTKIVFIRKICRRMICLSLLSLSFSANLFSAGDSCNNPITLSIDSTLNYNTFIIQDSITWFYAAGDGGQCRFNIRSNADTANLISSVELLEGNCGSLFSIMHWNFQPGDSMTRAIELGILANNGNYFIKITRRLNTNFYLDLAIQSYLLVSCTWNCTSGCNMISNGDFSGYVSGSPGNEFCGGVVCCWDGAWGTPQLQNASPYYAFMWSYDAGVGKWNWRRNCY